MKMFFTVPILFAMLLTLSLLSLLSCKKETVKTTTVVQGSTVSGDTLIVGMGGLSGALVMSGASGGSLAAADADIKFAGHPEYDTKASSSGNVSITNILPGTYTIYAEATLPAVLASVRTGTSRTDVPRMAQFKDIIVSATEATTLPDTILTEPGSISGTVSLINNPSNVTLDGIMVFIPGTSYIAMTDDEGAFHMTGIPAGSYDILRFTKDGLTSSDLYDVGVTSGDNTVLDEIRMSLSTGPSGAIVSIDEASTTVTGVSYPVLSQGSGETSVTVNLKYDTRAVLMKVAHESSFLNSSWVPVADRYTFTTINNPDAIDNFSTDGTKYVYVKFADLNGLESSVYYIRFIIDNDVPTVSSVELLFGWGNVGSTDQGDGSFAYQQVPMTLSASDLGTGVKQMIICNTSNFSGCSWETYATTKSVWDLVDGTAGTKTVYVKVRDYLGNESATTTDTIIVGSYTTLTSSTDDLVTLNKAWGPYLFDSSISFTGDLTVGPGVTIYYKSGFTITVEGILTIAGTSGSFVELKEYADGQTFAGFLLNTGLGGPHSINYLKIVSGNENSGYMFTINGGEIKNSVLYIKQKFIDKTGGQTLRINNNTISGPGNGLTMMLPLILLEDGENTTLDHNDFTMNLDDGAGSPVMINGKSLFSGALIQYNKFYFTDIAFSNNVLVRAELGIANFKYNDVLFDLDNSSSSPKIFHALTTGTINVFHNNLRMTPNNSATVALKYFEIQDSGQINAGNSSSLWNYSGAYGNGECGTFGSAVITSCTNDASFKYCGSAPTTMTGCSISQFSITAGVSGCVGHLCLESEN